jgi:mRNA-degrading endonuclease RelE of RelBE toxin-antitoxin system
MTYELHYSPYFIKQFEEIDVRSRRVISSKLDLLKNDPFRFKVLRHNKYVVCRIRLSIMRNEVRIICVIEESSVFIIGFVERKHNYADLDKLLRKAGFN